VWRRAIAYSAIIYLLIRLALSVLGIITVRDTPPPADAGFPIADVQRPVEAGMHNLLEGTNRWDAGWFIHIATSGYDPSDGSAEFYPAFPLASRTVAQLSPLGTVGASILVANAAFLAALVVLYVLSTVEYSESLARRSVALLSVYPASFILLSPFSESLFLLATVTAFYLVRRGRWWLGGAAGAVAAATRAVGILVAPAFLIEAWTSPERPRRKAHLIASFVPCVGLFAYVGYWWVSAGDPTIPLRAPELWGRTPQFALTMLGRSVALGFTGVTDADGWPWSMDLALTGVVLIPVAVWWRELRPSYLVYASCTFLVVLTVTYPPRPLVGAPRYACVVFPAFWLLARVLRGRLYVLTIACFAAGYIVLAITFMGQRTFLF
jgi:hypothetical protein